MTSNLQRWVRARLFLFVLLLCSSFAISQTAVQDASASRVSNYMVESGQNFTWDYGSYIFSGDGYAWMSLPFNFTYDGKTYPAGSTFIVSNDGWVSFDPNSYYRYDNGNVGNPSYPNTIYAVGLGLYNYYGTYWNVTGSTGKRVLTIMWDYTFDENWWYGNYFSLKLYEENNAIGFQYYGNGWQYSAYYMMKVGLNGDNGANGFSSYLHWENWYTPTSNFKMRPPKPDVPAMSVSPGHVQFNDRELGLEDIQCVTITNTGTKGEAGGAKAPLVIGNPVITGSPSEFTIVSGPSANNLDIGQKATVCVKFKPHSPNTRTSTLTIPSNANTENITMAGRGKAPEMAFEANYLFRKTKTKLEQSIEESFYIKSTGLAPLTVTDVILGGDYPSQYTIVERPMAPIAPGDSARVTIRLTPHYEGLKTARLTVRSNAFVNKEQIVHLFGLGILPRLTVTPGMITKDSIAMGDSMQYTIRLTNVGSDTVNILQHFMAFADKDFKFYPLQGMDTAIPPERFRDLFVTFTPTTRGHRQARIRILTDIPLTYEQNPRDTSIFEVDVFGTGVPYGLMSVEGNGMFDSALVGDRTCQTVKIWNNGQLALTVNSIDVLGANSDDFSFSGVTFPLTIQPQSSVDVQVCATPSDRGIRSASLAVNATSGDKGTTSEMPVEVYGLLACASPDVTAAFNESITRVGTSVTAPVVITNCGDVPATFTAAINGAAYALVGSATSPAIAPGATHTYEVTYNASAMIPQPGTLTVSATNGIDDMIIDLAGTGGNSVLAATNTNVTSNAGAPIDFDVTVTNSGNMDWVVGPDVVITPSNEFTLRGTAPSSVTSNNGTDQFSFTYTPAQGGTGRATVSFPQSDNTTFSFVLNGQTASVSVVAANGYELRQNYPNPFASASTIAFTMAEAGIAKIAIVDISGNVVATAANGFFAKGENTVSFDASMLPSGNYFFELTAGSTRLQRPMTIKK